MREGDDLTDRSISPLRSSQEFSKGGKLGKLMETVKGFELDIEKVKTKFEIMERGIAEEVERAEGLDKAIKEVCPPPSSPLGIYPRGGTDHLSFSLRFHQIQESRGARATRFEEATKAYEAVKTASDASTAKLASDEELLQTLLTGLTSSSKADDNASGGYMGQIATCRAQLSTASTEVEQAKLAVEHKEKVLKALEPKAKKAAKDGEGLGKELEEAKKRKAQLEKQLEGLGGDEKRERELVDKKAVVLQKLNGLLEVRLHLPVFVLPGLI